MMAKDGVIASGQQRGSVLDNDKHHSFTTEDHGLPELKLHLTKVMAYLDAALTIPSS